MLNCETRNVASMVEVSQFSGTNRRLIVVLEPYPGPGHNISGEGITKVNAIINLRVLGEGNLSLLFDLYFYFIASPYDKKGKGKISKKREKSKKASQR